MRLFMYLLVVFPLLVTTVFASDIQSSESVSLVPLFNEILEYVAVIIVGFIAWGFGRVAVYLRRWLGIRVDDSQRAVVMGAVERGVNYAANIARQRAANDKILTINTRSVLIAEALKYVQNRVPDALKHFNLSPNDIADMVTAKIEEQNTVDKVNGSSTVTVK